MPSRFLIVALTIALLLPPSLAHECPPGTYIRNRRCKKCPKGTYQNERNARDCKPCPAGTFWNYRGAVGVDLCRKCPSGTFSSKPGAKRCHKCPPGTLSRDGATKCLRCGPGYKISFNEESCDPCYYGHYRGANDGINCRECPQGTATSFPGSVTIKQCHECAPGREGRNKCYPCAAGSFRSGRDGSVHCKYCPPGFFTLKEGATSCKPCPPGTFKSKEYTSRCKPCPPGYTTKAGATFCRRENAPCPAGYFTKDNGDCEVCRRGYFRDLKTNLCEKCPAGLVSPGGTVTSCQTCDPDKIASLDQDVCLCAPGSELINGRCSLCPPGYWNNQTFSLPDRCIACSDTNKIASKPGSLECTPCPPGLANEGYAGTKCRPCPRGLVPRPLDSTFPRVCVSPQTNCAPGFKRKLKRDGSFFFCIPIRCPRNAFRTFEGCMSCKPGERQIYDAGRRYCTSCKRREVSRGGKVKECTKCKKGFVRSEIDGSKCVCSGSNAYGRRFVDGKCEKCPAGTFNSGEGRGFARCKKCAAGTFTAKTGRKKCENCPVDFFTDTRGATECKPCPPGTISYGLGEKECLKLLNTTDKHPSLN